MKINENINDFKIKQDFTSSNCHMFVLTSGPLLNSSIYSTALQPIVMEIEF
jgi:hypothetical protein